MSDYDYYLFLVRQLTELFNGRQNLRNQSVEKPKDDKTRELGKYTPVWIPNKLSKARMHRLRLELAEVLKRIEDNFETCCVTKLGEDWYSDA